MATRSSSNAVDVQKLLTGAAKLELKLLNAGVEAMQVYITQASRLTSLAGQTLQDIQDDKATLSDTAGKLTAFGRQNTQAFADLSLRLGASYFDELDRMAASVLKPSNTGAPASPRGTPPGAGTRPRKPTARKRPR
jgi:hypothetical protein